MNNSLSKSWVKNRFKRMYPDKSFDDKEFDIFKTIYLSGYEDGYEEGYDSGYDENESLI